MTTVTRPTIDLVDPASFAGSQPHAAFDWLREHEPVHRHGEPDGPGFWAVTRHDLVTVVGKDAGRFSSEPTIMLADPDEATDLGEHQMMLMSDPPLHTRMRRLVSRRFTPKAVRALDGSIAQLATRIVDGVIERGGCDLVTDLAGEMPSFVIADLLGIPLEDGRALYHHTEALHSSPEVVGIEAQRAAFGQMMAYSQQVSGADATSSPTWPVRCRASSSPTCSASPWRTDERCTTTPRRCTPHQRSSASRPNARRSAR